MLYKKTCSGDICKSSPDWFGLVWRFGASIAFDILDFFLGHIPIVGTILDIIGSALGYWLWGPWGLLQLWEIVDVTDQIDSWIPTLTISGIITVIKESLENHFQ